MLKAFLVFLTFMAVLPISIAEPLPSQTNRHFILWVHGIGGSLEESSVFRTVLNDNISKKSSQQFIFIPFDYPTTNDKMSTVDFAQQLGRFMNRKMTEFGGLRESDRLTVIGHSQGGIVNLLWLLRSAQNSKIGSPAWVPHIVSFITISTPFWGSYISNLGHRLKGIFGDVSILKQFGERQLEDLSISSDMVYALVGWVNQPQQVLTLQRLEKTVRFLQIGAYVRPWRVMPEVFSAGEILEEDMAVPITSTRFDTNYYIEPPKQIGGPAKVSVSDFVRTQYQFPFASVEGWHLPSKERLLGNASRYVRDYPPLVDIPLECLELKLEDCPSQAVELITEHILDEKLTAPTMPFREYAVDIRVRDPKGELNPKKVKVEWPSTYSLAENNEAPESTKKTFTDFRMHLVGKLRMAKESTIQVFISAPGYVTRSVEIPVQREHSSFIQINLAKQK